ncbi:MFS general substrate transporter [Pisolithus marmoratus]|nr:MFS general substrate transporter [Pisolithus marmoratus]
MPLPSDGVSMPEKNGVKFGPPSSPDVSSAPKLAQVSLGPERERKLWRKIDLHLMPIIATMYLLSFMDRGNAKLEGLMTQLNLTGSRYNVALSVFFISYGLFEFPANLTMWYPRYKLMYRIALFTGAAGAAGAFSGLFAYGISFMNVGHLEGWSWIFIIEGLVTIVISLIGVFVLVDYPNTAKFLSAEERQFVEQQRFIDTVDNEEGTVAQRVLSAFLDWQGGLFHNHPNRLYDASLPTDLGVGPDATVIYGTSIWYYVLLAHNIERLWVQRGHQPVTNGPYFRDSNNGHDHVSLELVGLIGYIIQITDASAGVKYFGTYLAVIGLYAGVPCAVGWLANNLHGRYKRAVGTAIQVGMGNLGGIIASYVFRIQDEPRFILGFAIEIGLMCMGLFAAAVLMYAYHRANVARIARAKREGLNPAEYAADLYVI